MVLPVSGPGAPGGVAGLPSVQVLGSRVHLPTLRQAVEILERWITTWQPGMPCRQVVVTGFHGLWEAHCDPQLKRVLNGAELWLPDGIAPVLIARLRGIRTARRVPGAELMRAFCALAHRRGYRSFLLGDTEDTLAAVRRVLERRYPGHRVAGVLSPPFRPLRPAEEEQVLAAIARARPDVLWVGLGTPKQDRWIHERRERLQVPVAIGVGAAFRFVGGQLRRAPRWVGELGLEWLWRLVFEPRKLWRRALWQGPRFVWHAGLELLGLRTYR
ncbi:MAG: UDP-N-acetyl-D-mannosaminuronic acid transferase [Planctomycetota bacterium]|nr:MAG: UDP-N-acetyl-D-mannosaminuronic acid transferase [Planctomycetota bacterium]